MFSRICLNVQSSSYMTALWTVPLDAARNIVPDDYFTVAEIFPGQAFGEVAFLDGSDRTADATALESSKLLVLNRRDFQPFLKERVALCLEVMKLLCQRLRHTTEQVEDLALRSLESRLARVRRKLREGFLRRLRDA